MAEGTIHLTDELTFIRPVGGSFQAFGTPFWGLFAKGGANLGAPIEKLYFLVGIADLRSPDFAGLARAALPAQRPQLSEDPAHVAMIFRNIAEVVERVYVAECTASPIRRSGRSSTPPSPTDPSPRFPPAGALRMQRPQTRPEAAGTRGSVAQLPAGRK